LKARFKHYPLSDIHILVEVCWGAGGSVGGPAIEAPMLPSIVKEGPGPGFVEGEKTERSESSAGQG